MHTWTPRVLFWMLFWESESIGDDTIWFVMLDIFIRVNKNWFKGNIICNFVFILKLGFILSLWFLYIFMSLFRMAILDEYWMLIQSSNINSNNMCYILVFIWVWWTYFVFLCTECVILCLKHFILDCYFLCYIFKQ